MNTCYFAKYRNKLNGISIALFPPHYFKGQCYPLLAPSYELLRDFKNKLITDQQYKTMYLELLNTRKLTGQKVLLDIGNDAVLLCYEKKEDFCHRHIVSEWLRSQNIDCLEL